MNIHKIRNLVALENTYILENKQSLLIIDPGSDWHKIHRQLEDLQKPIAAVLLTHTHYDHILSLDQVREHFASPPVYVAESEAAWLYTPEYNLSGLPRHDDMEDLVLRPAEEYFNCERDYDLGGFRFYALPTPGHSIGGISLVFPNDRLVFTGDALFYQAIGRTDLYTGDLEQLLTSIREQLFSLPKDYAVYPGHGQDTTIAHERMFNPFFH